MSVRTVGLPGHTQHTASLLPDWPSTGRCQSLARASLLGGLPPFETVAFPARFQRGMARQLLCFFMPDSERRQLQASRRAQCARWRLPARDLPQQVGGDNADAHGAGALASGRVYLPDEHGWQKRLSWSSTMGFAHVAFRDAATFTWPQGQCLQACPQHSRCLSRSCVMTA